MPQIIPTAEPFFFPGNETGVLLVHGFTGAPKEMRWMGESLHRRGYTVLGIRLAGHATRPEDMIRSRWQDWLVSVEDGYNLLRSSTDQTFLAGLSMGGVLALTFAARLGASSEGETRGVRGVIAMATPYALPNDWRLRYTRILSKLQPYLPKNKDGPGSGWFGDAWKQHVSYPQNPFRSIGELNHLLAEMRAGLPGVKIPALLIYSRDDDHLIRDSAEKVYNALGSSDKRLMWIEGSGHVVTEEPQREAVFKEAADFIARVSQAAGRKPGPAKERRVAGSA